MSQKSGPAELSSERILGPAHREPDASRARRGVASFVPVSSGFSFSYVLACGGDDSRPHLLPRQLIRKPLKETAGNVGPQSALFG
jgi:hypothetical protein